MNQYLLEFVASAYPGGRFTDAAGVEAPTRLKRPRLAKVETAGQRRRREKRELHERVKTAEVPRVRREGDDIGSWRAARSLDPLVDCSRCHVIIRESSLVDGLCEACAYGGGHDETV
jgi:hypothetical protein